MIKELFGLYCWCWTGLPRALFRKIFPEQIRPADYHWSKYDSAFAAVVRLTNGEWSSGNGTLWRRRRSSDDRWEYQQDEETLEEQMDRII
ncbi:hypothetical protein GGE68_002929 [Rhizobium leguminosarum]|uniref:hypothetical protein n=1 Tax=Rhizobium leguminosarum TaxID=384 RepID=UPI001617796F|nr:hypothetical protein [Rhizobium leguminosarum]MBB5664732.1 hypothetical protein [Rhizobium leguminosarum]